MTSATGVLRSAHDGTCIGNRLPRGGTGAPRLPTLLALYAVLRCPGKMSKYLGELKEGDSVAFKGPIPKYPYKPNTKKEIGMVAGGEKARQDDTVTPWQTACGPPITQGLVSSALDGETCVLGCSTCNATCL